MSITTLKSLLKDPVPDLKKISKLTGGFMKRPKLQKKFLKLMTKVWSEDEDSRRILAFLNILKAVDSKPDCISLCIKLLFSAYVKNCKFVLGSTLAHINFMRNSLLELFRKNLDEAYLHAFAYIRQLALTLRKAYLSRSEEDVHAVQNWQFINSLRLWTELIAKYLSTHKLLASLAHPMVQLLTGTIKLNPGERWIPLRFHCVSMLHTLAGVPALSAGSKSPGDNVPIKPMGDVNSKQPIHLVGGSLCPQYRLFVPSLALLLDVFQLVNFNRHASSASKAPLDLRLILHFSPSQKRETASLDAVFSWLFDLLAEEAALCANSVSFREFALPIINELKQFSRTCRVATFTRQMKALQAKLSEHSDYIEARRRVLRNLCDFEEVNRLEIQLSILDGSVPIGPFWNFYARHKEIRSKELTRLTNSHQKDVIPDEKDRPKRIAEDYESDDSGKSSSSDSDASYDYDDGKTVTHVSKSKKQTDEVETKQTKAAKSKGNKKSAGTGDKPDMPVVDEEESSESDFDLEAALNEEDEEEKIEFPETPDEVTDFELSDSEDGEDEADLSLEDDEAEEGQEDIDVDMDADPVPKPNRTAAQPRKPKRSTQGRDRKRFNIKRPGKNAVVQQRGVKKFKAFDKKMKPKRRRT
ncbi:unnamed protein product [Calicophoron daubneyi]|uniref:Nucleolar complex protein 2 homolog n=1 Tax=Calicophoron daubneyi TaxID=300641 RepID=A0AAV2TBW0_CALDB